MNPKSNSFTHIFHVFFSSFLVNPRPSLRAGISFLYLPLHSYMLKTAFYFTRFFNRDKIPFLKNLNPPAGSKTVEQLGEIVNAAGIPFIVKGIMTVSGAKKAFDAGASAIVVSNHGGRVLDQTPATAEVLERIVEWNQGRMKIFVDGGIRQGTDIFKALAMGADAVLIARPFVQVVYGGAEEGVKLYIEKLAAELSDTMAMCGAASIKDINRSMLYRPM